MGKVQDKLSNLILLVTIAISYLMWVVGVGTKMTLFIYENSMYFLAAALVLILILKMKELTRSDFKLILLAGAIFVFFTITSSIRHSNRFINAAIPLIILFLLCFKKTKFTKLDLGLLAGISGVALGATVYRIYTELPKLVPADAIWKSGNKLEEIWINTNTIGMALFLSTMMLTILIKSFDIGYFKLLVIPIYIVGLMSIWVCQSKASLGALVLFIIIDNIVPKKILQNNYLLLIGFSLIFILGPVVFYAFSKSDTLNLFTGRERIWAEFFEKWFSSIQNMLIGMEPFSASWKALGTHNSYIYTLGSYGILGYISFFGALIYFLGSNTFKKTNLSFFQISLLLGFLAICVQSTMEETLLATQWIPIVYSFVGIVLQKTDEVSQR